MKRKPPKAKAAPVAAPLVDRQPVLVLMYPPEPCGSCGANCWTACPVCRGAYCVAHIYDHHRGHDGA